MYCISLNVSTTEKWTDEGQHTTLHDSGAMLLVALLSTELYHNKKRAGMSKINLLREFSHVM